MKQSTELLLLDHTITLPRTDKAVLSEYHGGDNLARHWCVTYRNRRLLAQA